MKKFDVLLMELKRMGLPEGVYAVFGSAPLVVNGMVEDVNDLDIIVRPSWWGGDEKKELRLGDIEFFNWWPDFDVNDLIDNHSFSYKGVLFINPNKVIEYKKKLRREKDKNIWDI